jgi:hypothetical protein
MHKSTQLRSVRPSECNKSGIAYVNVNEGFEVLIDALVKIQIVRCVTPYQLADNSRRFER